MKKVSVIIPVKKRLEHLRQSLPLVMSQDYQNLEIIVVDYNCPEGTKRYCDELKAENVFCHRADVGENEWSLSAARNFGSRHATGEVLFFLDADALLKDQDFISRHVIHLVDGSFITGWHFGDATGCCMLHTRDFIAVKGYNEAIKSWGWDDIELYTRIEKTFGIEMRHWLSGIETIKHGDELRNEFHGGRHPNDTNAENIKIAETEFKGL